MLSTHTHPDLVEKGNVIEANTVTFDPTRHTLLFENTADRRLLHLIDTNDSSILISLSADHFFYYFTSEVFNRNIGSANMPTYSTKSSNCSHVRFNPLTTEQIRSIFEQFLIGESSKMLGVSSGTRLFPEATTNVLTELSTPPGWIRWRRVSSEVRHLHASSQIQLLTPEQVERIVSGMMWERAGLYEMRSRAQRNMRFQTTHSNKKVHITDMQDAVEFTEEEIEVPSQLNLALETNGGDISIEGYASAWDQPPYRVKASLQIHVEDLPYVIDDLRRRGVPITINRNQTTVLQTTESPGPVHLMIRAPHFAQISDDKQFSREISVGRIHRGSLSITNLRDPNLIISCEEITGDLTITSTTLQECRIGIVRGSRITR